MNSHGNDPKSQDLNAKRKSYSEKSFVLNSTWINVYEMRIYIFISGISRLWLK